MKIYIAGGSDELEIAEHYIGKARQAGAIITFDWPANIRRVGLMQDASVKAKRPNADECIDLGVRPSECVWALMPRSKSEGMFYELGAAHVLGIPFVISGERANAHLFSAHATKLYAEHDHALRDLENWFRNRAAMKWLVSRYGS